MRSQCVVITGGASGIGLGLAKEFAAAGWQVMIGDLQQAAIDQACAEIGSGASGSVCNVTDRDQLQGLWDAAVARFGRVDIWMNNAGVGSDQSLIRDTDPTILTRVVDVNVKGVVYGSQVAMQGMSAQQGGGYIYNTTGFGSNGFWRAGMTIYGTTKYGVTYFSKGIAREMADTDVKVGWINPGMVVTPLVIEEAKIMTPEQWAAGRRVFNMWGETVETTTQQLVQRILGNQKNGVNIHLLPGWKMLLKSLRYLFTRRDLFAEHGV